MGCLYEQGFTSVAAAAGAAYATIHTGATRRAEILAIELYVNAATASSVGLIRPSNTPVATTSALVLPVDPNDPTGTVNVDTAWSTAPTIGTVFHKKAMIPATIGNGVVWLFPPSDPLVLLVSSWLVIWNYGAGAGSVLNGSVILREK